MSDPLNRPLNRHPSSDTLTRPASTDAAIVDPGIHKRSSLPTDSTEDPIYSKDGGHGMLFHDFDGRLWLTLHQPNNSPNERPLWLEVMENGDGLHETWNTSKRTGTMTMPITIANKTITMTTGGTVLQGLPTRADGPMA